MSDTNYSVRNSTVYVTDSGEISFPVIVFLHGFTGSTTSWKEVIKQLKGKYRTIAVDLTGHGKSGIPTDASRYAMKEQLADLEMLFTKLGINHFTLVGYSMGGRIALAYTIKHPKRVKTLILESASPGLLTESERKIRIEADKLLSNQIISKGMRNFVESWENIPLFATQKKLPTSVQNAVRKERLSQQPTGLANSLQGIGTGSQPSYWGDLHVIDIPVLLINGEIDTKFVVIAREMLKEIPLSSHKVIKDAGHAIHVEKPTVFATIVDEYIMKVIK